MTIGSVSSSLSCLSLIFAGALLTSCAVDDPAVFSIGGARSGAVVKEKKDQKEELSAEEKKEAAAKAKLAAAKAKEEAAREAAEAKAKAKEKADQLCI